MTIPIVDACAACGNIVRTDERITGKNAEGKDLILHEVCFLRSTLAQEQHRSKVWGDLLRVLVHHLGNMVSFDLADVVKAAQMGPLASDQEGSRITIWVGERRRVVLAGALPANLPHPRT